MPFYIERLNDVRQRTDLRARNIYVSALSKVCFELLISFHVTQNLLARKGGRTSEVGAFNETHCMGNDIETGNYLSVETCRLHTFDDFMKEETNSRSKWSKGGRPIKNDPAKNCVMVRFSDQEYAKFLSMYEESGVYAKSIFVKARVFNESFRVIKTDEGTLKYVAKLTQLHAQFRAVGVNYNQVVKQLKSNFSEQKALALLYKLEKITLELVTTQQKIIALCEEFKQRFF